MGLALAAPATGLTIDGFGSPGGGQSLEIPILGANPTTVSSSAAGLGADALGGERDLSITRTAGTLATFTAAVNSGGSGSFVHDQGLGISGFSVLSWDGADNSPTLNPVGLGGVDLTEGGIHSAFELDFLAISAAATVTIDVFTNGGSSSSLGLVVSSPGIVSFAYGDFAGTADFANVGAIRLTLDGSASPNLDITLGSFVTSVPDPSSGLLLGVGLLMLALGGRRQAPAAR